MTPVAASGTALAGAALVVGGLTVVPTAAATPPDPVSGLVGRVVGQPSGSPARPDRRDLGHTAARNGVLRSGCHDYHYRYVVAVRSGDWTLETFLDDRTGDTIASGTYIEDSDPRRARKVFRFCRYVTHYGRFTIRAKITWYTDAGEHQRWFEPSHFHLRRP